jgi:hypothetical protein
MNAQAELYYCKYCYETHADWRIGGDYNPPEGHTVLECVRCGHATLELTEEVERLGFL